MKSIVMVFGTFDLFHLGHKSFLRQAREHGEYLIVVIGRDKTVAEVKRKKTTDNETRRLKNIKESNMADKVILGSLFDKYELIKRYRPDVICLGYDQKYFVRELKYELEKADLSKIQIIRLESYRPEIYKTSKLRRL
jgi:cytidyltransferase-like protein